MGTIRSRWRYAEVHAKRVDFRTCELVVNCHSRFDAIPTGEAFVTPLAWFLRAGVISVAVLRRLHCHEELVDFGA